MCGESDTKTINSKTLADTHRSARPLNNSPVARPRIAHAKRRVRSVARFRAQLALWHMDPKLTSRRDVPRAPGIARAARCGAPAQARSHRAPERADRRRCRMCLPTQSVRFVVLYTRNESSGPNTAAPHTRESVTHQVAAHRRFGFGRRNNTLRSDHRCGQTRKIFRHT